MIRLFSFLLTGCWHHWEIIKQGPLIRRNEFGDIRAQGTYYTLQCKHCGEIKVKDTV